MAIRQWEDVGSVFLPSNLSTHTGVGLRLKTSAKRILDSDYVSRSREDRKHHKAQMKKVATPGRTQSVTPKYNSKRTQRKAQAHKMLKKRKQDVAEDVAKIT